MVDPLVAATSVARISSADPGLVSAVVALLHPYIASTEELVLDIVAVEPEELVDVPALVLEEVLSSKSAVQEHEKLPSGMLATDYRHWDNWELDVQTAHNENTP